MRIIDGINARVASYDSLFYFCEKAADLDRVLSMVRFLLCDLIA